MYIQHEFEPASPAESNQECLAKLRECNGVLIMIGATYGSRDGGVSITHMEFRTARDESKPLFVFIKGSRETTREDEVKILLKEIDATGVKYKRFTNIIDLQKEVRSWLLGYLKQFEGVEATSDQEIIADQTIESTSRFESMTDSRVAWDDIDKKQAHDILARLEPDLDNTERSIQAAAIRQVLVWSDGDRL